MLTNQAIEKDIKRILERFSPEERGVLKAISQLRIEHRIMSNQLAELAPAYDNLFKLIITLLHAQPDREFRIHESQLLRFKNEYRLEQRQDKETGEIIFKLRTLTD